MIYNMEYETMPREAIEAIQIKRLQATLSRVYAAVGFYRKKLDEVGILPGDVKTLEDLKSLCRSHGERGAHPFIFGNNGAGHGGGIHGQGYQHLGGNHGQIPCRRGHLLR